MKRYVGLALAALSSMAMAGATGSSQQERWVDMLVGSVDQSLMARSHLIASGDEATAALVKGLSSWDEVKRTQCAEILAAIGRPAIPALAKALESDAPRVRIGAIRALDAMNSAEATRLLISAAYDVDWWVRSNVAIALRDTQTPDGLDALTDMAVNDADARVRDRADLFLQERPLR